MSERRPTRAEIARQRRAQRAARELTQAGQRALKPVMPVTRVVSREPVSYTRKAPSKPRTFKIALGLPEIHLYKPKTSTSVRHVHSNWRIASTVIALLLSTAIYFALSLPYFHVPSVTVLGNNRLTQEEIQSVIGVMGQSIFVVQPDDAAMRLRMNYPELLSAEVKVYLPNYVYVTITERQPVILWQQNGGYTWVDSTGVAFRPRGAVAGLVPVTSLATPPAGVRPLDDPLSPPPYMQKELVDAILALAPTVPAGTTMFFDPNFGLGWKDGHGWKSYFGTSAQDMPLKVRVYQSLVDSLLQRGVTPIFINVMYPDAPFYRVVKVVDVGDTALINGQQ